MPQVCPIPPYRSIAVQHHRHVTGFFAGVQHQLQSQPGRVPCPPPLVQATTFLFIRASRCVRARDILQHTGRVPLAAHAHEMQCPALTSRATAQALRQNILASEYYKTLAQVGCYDIFLLAWYAVPGNDLARGIPDPVLIFDKGAVLMLELWYQLTSFHELVDEIYSNVSNGRPFIPNR